MPEPDAALPILKARIEALQKGSIPSAPPGPGPILPLTWAMLVFALLPAIVGGIAALSSKDSGCLGAGAVVGAIFLFIFLICLIVDVSTPSPKSRTTPERAVKAFYGALRRKSYKRAYACLSPIDRIADLRPTLAIPALDVTEKTFSFETTKGFAAYWREQTGLSTGFLGGYHKTIQAKILHVTPLSDSVAAADIRLDLSGYPALATLGVLCGLLPAVLLIILMTRREHFEVRKLLVKKDGLWWILNGEFTPEGDEAIERLLATSGKS